MPKARVGDIELHYESEGEGLPLVLIMGIGTQLTAWPAGLRAALVERGLRVIRFDNRDIGLSSKLTHLPVPKLRRVLTRTLLGMLQDVPYTLEDMAADTAGLLDALELDSAHILGASMGGMIAQVMALHHPQRMRSLCSVMSHPGNLRSMVARPKAYRALMSPLPKEHEAAVTHMVGVMRALSGSGFPFDEDAARAYLDLAIARSVHPQGFLRQFAAIAAAPNRIPALRSLRMPSLVIHGTDDPLVPVSGGRATAKAIPGARLHLVPGMGHDFPRGAWPQIADAVSEHVRDAERARA
ncbi:alpha/beta fold hydrolase [Haliangium ochraceum]|uniref:Alpha/beta hydrolase fold protein n=1 Tax=Haliangium ochraceum (strain DSM 14365 / JCM 11303 / SMP-2) TaxID=502025 RepID=D0LX47_HALO1|nr:alpha/beta hydrolase [Haliangium ochraceum]ACY16089.1 alpha/beta hydrolase fold protein [Haliangium ochraceum DSM 14365]